MRFLIEHTPTFIKKTYWAPAILASIRERMYRRRYYNDDRKVAPDHKQAVFMVDGRFLHGGLCDRLWGITSSYVYCREHGIDFRLHWVYPFNITTFLEPSEHDWRIKESEISYNPSEASPVFVNHNHNKRNQWRLLKRIGRNKAKQVHIYSPAHYDTDNFSRNFNELFRPTPVLARAIDEQLKAIGCDYISITFRFQQLLGDFKEGDYPTLPPEKQTELLDKSIETIKRIHEENPGYERILVTSDSKTLLAKASELPYVYVIPGELVHMSYTDATENELVHIKAFLDFFMIGYAKRVYFALCEGVYWSTFAYTAAKLHDAPFELTEIK